MYHRWTSGVDGALHIHPVWNGGHVRAGFSFRKGGVSEAPWNELNLSFRVGDDAKAVLENRERWAKNGFEHTEDWVTPQQVHAAGVAVVTGKDKGRGALPDSPPIPDVDALVTNVPGVTLVVMAADCVPVLFYDEENQAIGAAHSGWRGTVGHIATKTIQTMTKEFGTNPSTLQVAIGPSIRACCYEVDARVADVVRGEFGAEYLRRRPSLPGKYLLSLQDCIRCDLLSAGVLRELVEDVGVCTSCHHDVLFSHRADNGKSGRQCGAIQLEGGTRWTP